MTSAKLKTALRKHASAERKATNEWFFKTGKGEYGYGDVFIGVRVPDMRRVAKEFKEMSLLELAKLLNSKVHEERLISLYILVDQFNRAKKKGEEKELKKIYTFYLKHKARVNNWDLVDSSAHYIVGAYHLLHPELSEKVLVKLAKSKSLWDRRIAIIATFEFIKHGIFKPTFTISDLLLEDKEDLMHKAVGWMIREVGNRDLEAERKYLKPRYNKMPRTMLRYAIEKFPEVMRKAYLHGKI